MSCGGGVLKSVEDTENKAIAGALFVSFWRSSNAEGRDIGNDTAKCTVCQLVIGVGERKLEKGKWKLERQGAIRMGIIAI
jgi:hypothetical protein